MIEKIIDILFDLFGARFKGYHTQIVAILGILTGAWKLFGEAITPFTCEHFKVLCDFETSKAGAAGFIIMGAAMYILRKFTDTPAGDMRRFHLRFTKQHKDEVQKLTLGKPQPKK